MKSCEPRDLLNRVSEICHFEGSQKRFTPELIDLAWRHYFGASHDFDADKARTTGQASVTKTHPRRLERR